MKRNTKADGLRRRDFLQLSGAAGMGLMLPSFSASAFNHKIHHKAGYEKIVPEIFVPTPSPPSHTKAIVIGSGFGGAISALRLAQAGIQTTVLERGLRWPRDPNREIFPVDWRPDGRGYWRRNAVALISGKPIPIDYFNGVFDESAYPYIKVWRGACVGGGSMVFTGCMIEPEQQYFEAIFGNVVNYNEMHQTYYPLVRQMLNLTQMPTDIYNSDPFAHSRVWDQQVTAAGYAITKSETIFNWDIIRQELAGTSRPSATAGQSNLGNSNGAKFDLNQNYIKQAEATGLATVYPSMEVMGISQNAQGQYLVDISNTDPFGSELKRFTISCDYLFLGAGSIGTSELLVRARARGDLPKLNEYIGQGWGGNGDTIVIRTGSYACGPGRTQGTPSASRIIDKSQRQPVTLENWYALDIPENLGICGSLGMVFDQDNRGSFSYDSSTDKVTLDFPKNGNDDVVAQTRVVNNKICHAANAHPGILGQDDVNGRFTAHPLGGAVIGLATDNYGRVAGYKGLYVMDGALIPGTTGAVNPSLTISALAERNIAQIIKTGY